MNFGFNDQMFNQQNTSFFSQPTSLLAQQNSVQFTQISSFVSPVHTSRQPLTTFGRSINEVKVIEAFGGTITSILDPCNLPTRNYDHPEEVIYRKLLSIPGIYVVREATIYNSTPCDFLIAIDTIEGLLPAIIECDGQEHFWELLQLRTRNNGGFMNGKSEEEHLSISKRKIWNDRYKVAYACQNEVPILRVNVCSDNSMQYVCTSHEIQQMVSFFVDRIMENNHFFLFSHRDFYTAMIPENIESRCIYWDEYTSVLPIDNKLQKHMSIDHRTFVNMNCRYFRYCGAHPVDMMEIDT
jgi:hypothetical protein